MFEGLFKHTSKWFFIVTDSPVHIELSKSVLTSPYESPVFSKQLIQALPVAVYTCNAEGKIQFYNKAAIEIWGREPVIGEDLWCGSWKIWQLNGAYLPLEECPMALALRTGKPVRAQEVIIERPDGSRVNVLPHPDPLFDEGGNLIGAVNTLVDITDLRKSRQLNQLLKEYNDKLEEFAYAASHDMQEPLRKIHTFSNMLLESCGNQLDAKGKNYLDKICGSAERMNSIIQDLLNYSRDTNALAPVVETDLNAIVKNIKADLEIPINNKEAIIKCGPLPVIKAIPSQMNRLFYNLIQNALKFSKADVAPVIVITVSESIMADEENNAWFEIMVKDNGIGFDNKYADKVFSLFQRLNERHLYNGNGIGLALCKKIVENHHGHISVDSSPGTGTTFFIRFPVELVV